MSDDPEYLKDQIDKAKDDAYRENQAAAKLNDFWVHEAGKAQEKIDELESKLKCCQELFDASCKDHNNLRDKIKKVVKKWSKYSSPQPAYMDSPSSPEYYFEQQMKKCAREINDVLEGEKRNVKSVLRTI